MERIGHSWATAGRATQADMARRPGWGDAMNHWGVG